VRQTRNFQQVADFRLACAGKYRRGERNAVADPSHIEQLSVLEVAERLPDDRVEKPSRTSANASGRILRSTSSDSTLASPRMKRSEILSDLGCREGTPRHAEAHFTKELRVRERSPLVREVFSDTVHLEDAQQPRDDELLEYAEGFRDGSVRPRRY